MPPSRSAFHDHDTRAAAVNESLKTGGQHALAERTYNKECVNAFPWIEFLQLYAGASDA